MIFSARVFRLSQLWIWVAVVAVVLGAAGYFGWRRTPGPPSPEVLHANNQGVGYAECFQWPRAVAAFEEVVQLAPEWLPGRINLGIALLNANTEIPGALERARSIFGKILEKEPENPYAHFCLGIIMRYESKPEETETAAAHFKSVTQVDPKDAAAWYWYGSSLLPEGSEEQNQCY